MDQDSRFTGNYVASALATARSSHDPGSVGMVCAESHNHIPLPTWGGQEEPQIFDPMTSGPLVRTSSFKAVGFFDEGFFIDCVDSEFNARLRERGLRALAGRGCNLEHSLGNARPMKILGWHAQVGSKKLYVYYHAPFRVYYITRNSLVLARRYALKQPKWVVRRIYMEIQSHVVRFGFGRPPALSQLPIIQRRRPARPKSKDHHDQQLRKNLCPLPQGTKDRGPGGSSSAGRYAARAGAGCLPRSAPAHGAQ
jgi:rhamnosyltransferase